MSKANDKRDELIKQLQEENKQLRSSSGPVTGHPFRIEGELEDSVKVRTGELENAYRDLQQNYAAHAVISSLLSLSTQDISLQEILDEALRLIVGMKWHDFLLRGYIFVAEKPGTEFMLCSEEGEAGETCKSISVGNCVCGIAALEQKVQYGMCKTGRTGYSHCSVPIVVQGETLGVMNLLLSKNHVKNESEDKFLMSVADTVAGLIVRKRAEAARKEAEEDLARQQLLTLRADRLRSLGEMAAGIAHELNQPLVGVRGMAELMLISQDRKWELSQDDIREKAQMIVDQADRMSETQVLDAVDENHGRINVSTTYDSANGTVVLSITDNGPGIPSSELQKVFNAFHSTKGHGGTGLGLAAAKKIVDELGGDLVVTSEVGKGTTFRLTLSIERVELAPDGSHP
ncbi:MAG: hypothetical protein IIB38_09575 [Candidatus Hydrogenedentes bacterium]|nr:hypothetical protein [Candidatus Hydrogenedentota bacterium]